MQRVCTGGPDAVYWGGRTRIRVQVNGETTPAGRIGSGVPGGDNVNKELEIEGRYQVVFSGMAVSDVEPGTVRERFREKFRLPEQKFEQLFSGDHIVVQKDISWKEARRYQQLMTELGAACEILPLEQETDDRETRPTFPCPECRTIQSQDTCEKCGFDIKSYRYNMRGKGFVDLPGAGFITDRRAAERRNGSDRRDGVRFEDGRRGRTDRRRLR